MNLHGTLMRLAALIGCAAGLLAPPAHALTRVFACEPEWAALAAEIGGDRVRTDSATTAMQDPHYLQARPSLIARVRRADLMICSGAQLEIGWLPVLLAKANNPRVLPGSPGFIEASAWVTRLEVPQQVDRSQGDVHPSGNPHVQMNPHNIAAIAPVLAERLAKLDPEHAPEYRQRLDDFVGRWRAAIGRWEDRAQPLAGQAVITHHQSWAYLEDWLHLQRVATLEPLPGVPPTPAHLAHLLQRFRDGGAAFILRAPFQDPKPSRWLSERTGIPALTLPLTVGGSPAAKDLFSLFDDVLDRLLGALCGDARSPTSSMACGGSNGGPS